jgi:hypothetical protein
MIEGRWHFIKLENDQSVAKFKEKADRQRRIDGAPAACEVRLRIEPGGSQMVFLDPAASALVAKLPIFSKMMRPLHPSLVERVTAVSRRIDIFSP